MPITTILPVSASTPRAPRVLWQSLLRTATTLTASAQSAGFEVVNLLDGLAYTAWKQTGNTTATITLTLPASALANALGVHLHDLHQSGGKIRVEAKDLSGTWVIVCPDYHPPTGAPFLLTFADTLSDAWRLVITCPSGSATLGTAYLGQALRLERGCWDGSTPPWMAPEIQAITTRSENGTPLGRSVKRLGVKFAMDFDHLTAPFVRSQWMPFIASVESMPFFVQWNPTEYPDEIAFAWVEDPAKDIRPPKWTGPDHLSCGLTCKGLVL
jgi:hypothetical protein